MATAKQPIVLRIGYTEILLPNDTGLQTIMRALRKGLLCREAIYRGRITILERPEVRVEVSSVPHDIEIHREDEEPTARPTNGRRRMTVDRPLLEAE